MAPPLGVALDSPQSADMTLTGAFSGSVMCIVLRESRRPVCASALAPASSRTAPMLVRIDIIDGHLTRLVIDVTGAKCAGNADDNRLLPASCMQQRQRVAVLIQFNSRWCGSNLDSGGTDRMLLLFGHGIQPPRADKQE